MKKMTKVISLALALVMCLALCACGQKDNGDTAADGKKTFVMGVDPEYPPFSYLGDDGKYTGFDVEIAQAACDLLGWDLQVFGVNWDQKLVQLDAKECDCVWSGMTILDSMKDAGYVLSKPYYDNTQVIMVKEGSDIKSSADLAGKNVAVQLGTSGESLLSEGGDLESLAKTFGKLTTCDSFLKCFTELGRDRRQARGDFLCAGKRRLHHPRRGAGRRAVRHCLPLRRSGAVRHHRGCGAAAG